MEKEIEQNLNRKDKRFEAIYGPEEKSSSSESEDEQVKFGNQKLSKRRKEKLISYLCYEIDISR